MSLWESVCEGPTSSLLTSFLPVSSLYMYVLCHTEWKMLSVFTDEVNSRGWYPPFKPTEGEHFMLKLWTWTNNINQIFLTGDKLKLKKLNLINMNYLHIKYCVSTNTSLQSLVGCHWSLSRISLVLLQTWQLPRHSTPPSHPCRELGRLLGPVHSVHWTDRNYDDAVCPSHETAAKGQRKELLSF